MDDGNSSTTKLLTLLNVSAVKSGKRRRVCDDAGPSVKLNKRKSVAIVDSNPGGANKENAFETSVEPVTMDMDLSVHAADDDDDSLSNPYQVHFGITSPFLSDASRAAAERGAWDIKRETAGRLGKLVQCLPEGSQLPSMKLDNAVIPKLRDRFKQQQEKLATDIRTLQNEILDRISNYQDLYLSRASLETQSPLRNVIALHALNHIIRKRRRVVKNNDRISAAAKDSSTPLPADIQDQGFTRPSVLILLPLRSSALRWMQALISYTPSHEYQIENHSRFLSEYGLPEGVTDKLETAPNGTYPPDHVEMFKGNVDDSFRVGVKMTRKSVKIFADFYQCDLIIASPLGLRMSIEKEKNADFLSSIEVLVVDQLDALTMQNWEHVQFVFSKLNQIPKEPRDADFSRIKPWYLDGLAAFLRQTIMMSAYDTPEIRSLFNSALKNVAGKRRTESCYQPLQVPDGVNQTFVKFECSSAKAEADQRFQYFTSKMLPAVMKSAVQSTNTVLFVPSSFDFIRVQNHLKRVGVMFVVLSEYSSNQDISRARQAFFSGRKPFLLVTERFHFFRRYKIRGIRNLIFYAPPDHAQFYSEFLSYPFLDDGVDGADISSKVLFSKYDWMRLERIAGTEGAAGLLKLSA